MQIQRIICQHVSLQKFQFLFFLIFRCL
ncbi:MAG: hypothetical protein ACPLN0_00300 [Candidatus Hydrothermia bacterium]